ncbi:DUF4430 domain-containing protein [Massilimicrobiota timonensis]|uniref:DUF4430 domain-containing protein n=1 Tax=Massilimicrobiota timonensis TaxID=1776392 RepID=UPI00195F88CE|nr:DUF4430 domain-containing protein [Massilimicrobiota timonensis]MBM6966446.1 DUF4430 domain-containing protein [Massilimicrobiota timonensis]
MNKTKKYTLIFIVLCFICIGGAGIYHTCFVPNQETKEVVENKETESEVSQQVDVSKETSQQDESSQEKEKKQTSQKKEKETEQKTESQTTKKIDEDASNQKTSEPKQQPQETLEEVEEESQIEEVASINVIITGVDGVMAQDYVEFEEGMSAYDALKILADNYEMTVKISGIGQAVYVKGINGLMEFDYGGQSGWKYKVNGAYPSLGAGAYILKDGDQVEWIYSTNG